MAHSKCINIPVKLLEETRDDRKGRSLAALSVAIKCWSPSSRYDFETISKFAEDFDLSYRKAKSLLDAARSSKLFQFTDNGGIIAKDFTPLYCSSKLHHGKRHSRMLKEYTAAKVTCWSRENISIGDIERELKEASLLYLVSVENRMNEFIGRNSHHPFEGTLTIGKFASYAGMSKRNAIRYIKSLEERGELVVGRFDAILCEAFVTPVEPTFYDRNNRAFFKDVNVYHLVNKFKFANIIQYYALRIAGVQSQSVPVYETKRMQNGLKFAF